MRASWWMAAIWVGLCASAACDEGTTPSGSADGADVSADMASDSTSDVGTPDTAGPDTPVEDVPLVEDVVPDLPLEDVPLVEDVPPVEDVPLVEDVPPVEDVPLVEDVAPDVPTEDVPPLEDVTPDVPLEDVPPIEDVAPDLPIDDVPPIEDVTPDLPIEDVTPDLPIEDVTPDAPSGLPDGPSSDRHTARPLGTTAAGQGYWEYLPPGYGDGQLRPLLLFLHGLGENGNGTDQLDQVKNNGPPKLIDKDQWPSDRPFVVISPQHGGGGCHNPSEIAAMLDYAMISYDIDPTRVYITGLSCGGIGTWNYLGNYTDQVVAAAVPICGDGKGAWNKAGCALGNVAIWAFHGDADPTVNVSGTNVPIDNLLTQCEPAKEVKKTIYPGVGHNSWAQTYNMSAGYDIYTWLLQWTNDGVTPPPPPSDEPLAIGRTVSIDFGPAATLTAPPWANIPESGLAIDLADDLGDPTMVDALVSAPFNGTNPNGLPGNTLGLPGEASGDSAWVGSFDGHDAALGIVASVTIGDLEPGATYDVLALPARTGDDGGIGRLTRYTVDGAWIDVEASDNTSDVAVFTDVVASGAGEIVLDVEVSPDGTGRFAYLNALEVTRTGP